MEPGASEPQGQAPSAPTGDAAAWAAGVETAWGEGAAGWERLAAAWDVPLAEVAGPAEAAPARCWWDMPPWCGEIAADEFRAIVAAYVVRFGAYAPDLPEREPDVLREWLRARGRANRAPGVAA